MTPLMRRFNIVQGEYRVADQPDVLIGTLLGSCIAVCLHDAVARVGGMNHFLLGDAPAGESAAEGDFQRYGVHAMELLINAMMQRGAVRDRLRAHLYGGANIMAGLGQIGSSNADFARRFIAAEGISLGHTALGGNAARRVEFLPFLGKVRSWTVVDAPVSRLQPVVRQAPAAPVGELELF